MLKRTITILSSMFFVILLLTPDSYSAPSTKGRLGLGGQMGIGVMPGAISIRYGVSDSLKLNGLAGFNIAPNNVSIGLGFQAEFALNNSKKDLLPYFGAGIHLAGLGTKTISADIAPILGVEYFLTPEFTFDAALAVPITFSFATGTSLSLGINTYVNPILGFHYYF